MVHQYLVPWWCRECKSEFHNLIPRNSRNVSTSEDWKTSPWRLFGTTRCFGKHRNREAQEGIDPVVGRSRLPTFGGRPPSPYIEAMLTETLERGSLVPLSAFRLTLPWTLLTPHADFSHLSLEDDYDDHRIPKGFLCTSLLYGLQHVELVLFQVLGNLCVTFRDE